MRRLKALIALSMLPFALAIADTRQPVGLVLQPAGSKLLRGDTLTPLSALAGDLLYAGDGLKTESGAASFLFCPAKVLDTLSPSGEVRFDAKQAKVKSGKISEQPRAACMLPPTLRVDASSQQHYGVTMTRGVNQEVPPIPRGQLAADVIAELAPFDTALAKDPKDQAALIAEATIFENHKLLPNALEVYNKLRGQWPDAVWIKSKVFELQQAIADQAAAATAAATAGGKTYALLVGISRYGKPDLSLQFPHADANGFGQFLASPRGGAVPPDNMLLLTDEKATRAAVVLGFQDFLKRRATKADTVIILIASHGTVDGQDGYILTYDSDPQDLKSTALRMAELQKLFEEQVSKVGRVVLFVDVCKSGTIGTIRSTSVNAEVENLKRVPGELLAMMAARPRELSQEGPQFGGGHGAFSYYILKALSGTEADEDQNGIVDGEELITYVTNQVPKVTNPRQHPTNISPAGVGFPIADLKKPGIDLAHWRMIFDSRTGQPRLLASASAAPAFAEQQATEDIDRFTSAINAGRILPDQPENAFTALAKLKTELDPEQYTERENQLRVALENKAQEVLLKYLEGEQTPQTREEFAQGGRYMEAARTLTRESLFLEGRSDFFQGRALLFDKNFPQAANLLEQSVRIDPGGAYGFNALGIAYLEQAEYQKAIPAFRDAVRRAQHWAYPLHNVALAYVETGDYKSAIRAYQDAIRLAPKYSYLPYNLGLVYQRLNRRKDAEASYRQASLLDPNLAQPYNALATLKASEGKRADAERLYKEALQKNPNFLEARHNLALLLTAEKNRQDEAIGLWRENLRQAPDHLPSHLSLAATLADRGDNAGAIAEYRKVLELKPGYLAARTALAGLLAKAGDTEGALQQLREAAKLDLQNFGIFEQIGDLEAGRQHNAEARAAYQSALSFAPDRAARKRISNKLSALH